jgi:hypothetical protein
MFAEITFASDKFFGLVVIGQRVVGAEYKWA